MIRTVVGSTDETTSNKLMNKVQLNDSEDEDTGSKKDDSDTPETGKN